MAKRLTEKEKKDISSFFIAGETLEELSAQFNCTKLTISRNLKKYFGEKKFKEIINTKKASFKSQQNEDFDLKVASEIPKTNFVDKGNFNFENDLDNQFNIEKGSETQFTEIIPLNCDIENSPQKDLSSIPISDVNFPKMVYMVVDKNIELQIKFLKDYPDWNFLSKDELDRKTIEIHTDQKVAKRSCNKDQKVIKVPNTDVFKIVAPLLVSRGISRIVSPDKLISL